MRRALLSALVLLFGGCLEPALAQPMPGEPNWQVARFPSGATTVVVDVVDLGGSQIGSDRPATRVTIDAANSDAWAINLATVPGYPVNCEPHTYLLRWAPDAANCTASPATCFESTAQVGGAACKADPRVKATYTYATAVVSAQGISQSLLDWHAKRGQQPTRWREIRHASDGDFASPESTEWEVFFYRAGPTWPELACTVRTATDPSSSLPSGCP